MDEADELEEGFRDLIRIALDKIRSLQADVDRLTALVEEYRTIHRTPPAPPPVEKVYRRVSGYVYKHAFVCASCQKPQMVDSTHSKAPKYCETCRPLAQAQHIREISKRRQDERVAADFAKLMEKV